MVGANTGSFIVGNTDSDSNKENKMFSEKGRQVLFGWSLGLGILIGLFVYFLLIYVNWINFYIILYKNDFRFSCIKCAKCYYSSGKFS